MKSEKVEGETGVNTFLKRRLDGLIAGQLQSARIENRNDKIPNPSEPAL
jgi:hypothetical protein